jgi:hypothetical protein
VISLLLQCPANTNSGGPGRRVRLGSTSAVIGGVAVAERRCFESLVWVRPRYAVLTGFMAAIMKRQTAWATACHVMDPVVVSLNHVIPIPPSEGHGVALYYRSPSFKPSEGLRRFTLAASPPRATALDGSEH